MSEEGFMEWLSVEDISSKPKEKRVSVFGKKKTKKSIPQAAITLQEAGRVALLNLCCGRRDVVDEAQPNNRQFKIYKTKKLIFNGAELCGWAALHIFFAPESTEMERKRVLYRTVKRLLDHGFIKIIPGQTSFDKSIPIDPQVEFECPVGLEIKYQINEEELLLGIEQKLQSINLRMAMDVLSDMAVPKPSSSTLQDVDWQQMKSRILELDEETNSNDIRYFVDEETGKKLIAAASLEKLIERLANVNQPDVVFRDSFLLTYLTFVDSITLLCLLQDRWKYKSAEFDNFGDPKFKELIQNTAKAIQLRVLNFLKLWIETYPSICNGPVIPSKLNLLFEDIKLVYPSAEKTLSQALQSAKKKSDYIDTIVYVEKPEHVNDFDCFSFSFEEIAEQLTLADHALFCRIQPSELLFQNWTREDKWSEAENVCNLELRFDAIVQWISCMVLEIRLEKRVQALQFVIHLAYYLKEIKNYFSSTAIIFALKSAPISRLLRTWEIIDEKASEKFNELVGLYAEADNNKPYRDLLRKIRPPCVPFLGLFLKDITDIEQSYQDNVCGLINFEKRIRMGKVLMSIKQFQHINFRFEPNNDILWQVIHLPKKDYSAQSGFLNFSRKIEPDDPDKMVEELLLNEKSLKSEIMEMENQLDRYAIDIAELEKENKNWKHEILSSSVSGRP